MKTTKKILSIILTAIIIMSVCVISSSAATATPRFELKLVEQNDRQAKFILSLVDGCVNSFDITFTNSSAISGFNYIYTTDEFDDFIKQAKRNGAQYGESSSTENKKISLACTQDINAPASIYEISVFKSSSANLLPTDIGAKVTSCVAFDTEMATKASVGVTFGGIEITESITMNYKSNATIVVSNTNLKADEIVWTTSNPKVVTVDEDGIVTATGKGTATVTASSKDGSICDTCAITVNYSTVQWIIIILLFGWIWY